jgi:CDGSH-type Zn-finger protein
MATKAGRVQLSDIKQGRVFYRVHADFDRFGNPIIRAYDELVILARPISFTYYAGWLQEIQKVRRIVLAAVRKITSVSSSYVMEHIELERIFGHYGSEEITDLCDYTPIFVNKRAADRFIERFKLRRATVEEQLRATRRFHLNQPGMGPRGHISDFDVMRPLSIMPEPSAELQAQWNAAFEQSPASKEPVLICDCGQRGQYPFYLGAHCHFCNTEFKDRTEELPLGIYQGLVEKIAVDRKATAELPEPVHFYKGDQLKVIDNKDEDELCEGAPAIGEIMTMMDRSSEHRSHIIVKRENGRELQLEKRRFELHQRGGAQGVIVKILSDDEIPLDNVGNRADIILDACSPHPAMFDLMAGKISQEECEHRIAESNKRVVEMLAAVPTPKKEAAPNRCTQCGEKWEDCYCDGSMYRNDNQ